MLESLLEAIDRQLSQGKISWGAIITAILFFNKIQRNKEFRIRDKRVERNQQRIMEKLDVIGEWAVDKPSWSERIVKKLWTWLRTIISHAPTTESSIHRLETKKSIWRFKMKQLMSKKFILAILGAIIPVINGQFGINLSLDVLLGIWTVLGIGIAGIAHVDAKTVSAVKVAVTADPNATYRDMIKTINIVHNAITSIHNDLKKDDGLQAFRDAADDYKLLESIVLGFKKPAPLPEIPTIPEQKVS